MTERGKKGLENRFYSWQVVLILLEMFRALKFVKSQCSQHRSLAVRSLIIVRVMLYDLLLRWSTTPHAADLNPSSNPGIHFPGFRVSNLYKRQRSPYVFFPPSQVLSSTLSHVRLSPHSLSLFFNWLLFFIITVLGRSFELTPSLPFSSNSTRGMFKFSIHDCRHFINRSFV